MNLKQLVKKIKQDTWWSEEAPGNYQYILAAWRAFSAQRSIYGKNSLSACITLYRNDFCYEKTSETEKLRQFYGMLKEFSKAKGRFKYYSFFLNARSKMLAVGERSVKLLEKSDNERFADLYGDFYKRYTELVTHAVMPEAADIYTEQSLLPDFEKEVGTNVGGKETIEIAFGLISEPILSFMEKERADFLKQCLSESPKFGQLVKNYHWIQNNYLSPKFLNVDHFLRQKNKTLTQKTTGELKKELASLLGKPHRIRRSQRLILKKFHLSAELGKELEFLRLLAKWIDQRKAAMMQAVYYIDVFLAEISRRTGIGKAVLGYYLPEEIASLLRSGVRVHRETIKRRKNRSVYVTLPIRHLPYYKEKIFYGRQADRIFNTFKDRNTRTLAGMAASAPVAELVGRVKVVLNPHKERFTSGVLVTTMTRPDFVPLMRRASAIITDEGGLTCHAAIVSRELGIPCIIGTKNATKVLRSGQRVVMDLKTGKIEVAE